MDMLVEVTAPSCPWYLSWWMFRNTGEEVPMLVGNIVAITAGAAISLGVSLVTRGPMTRDMQDTEWEKTRSDVFIRASN